MACRELHIWRFVGNCKKDISNYRSRCFRYLVHIETSADAPSRCVHIVVVVGDRNKGSGFCSDSERISFTGNRRPTAEIPDPRIPNFQNPKIPNSEDCNPGWRNNQQFQIVTFYEVSELAKSPLFQFVALLGQWLPLLLILASRSTQRSGILTFASSRWTLGWRFSNSSRGQPTMTPKNLCSLSHWKALWNASWSGEHHECLSWCIDVWAWVDSEIC